MTPQMKSVDIMCSLLTAPMTESTESSEEDLAAAADSDYACLDSESTSHDDSTSDNDDHINQYTRTEESVTKASAHRQALVHIPVMFMAVHSETLQSVAESSCYTVQVDAIPTGRISDRQHACRRCKTMRFYYFTVVVAGPIHK